MTANNADAMPAASGHHPYLYACYRATSAQPADPQRHHGPHDAPVDADAALHAELQSLLAGTHDALVIATDDGSTVYAHAAQQPHPVPALASAILTLSRGDGDATSSTAEAIDTPALQDALAAALWEYGMEHTQIGALLPTAPLAETADPAAATPPAVLYSTAADLLLLVQKLLADEEHAAPSSTGNVTLNQPHDHTPCGSGTHTLAQVPGISLLDAAHGSTICVIHLTTPPLRLNDPRHTAILNAVCVWLQATPSHAPSP